MQLKWKAIIGVMLLVCGICTGYLYFFFNYSNKALRDSLALQTRSAANLAAFINKNHTKQFRHRIENFVDYNLSLSRKNLILAFRDRDRKKLQKYSEPFLNILRRECPYFASMAWLLPDNTVFLRVHKPHLYGDNVGAMRKDIAEVNRTHKPLSGYAVGHVGLQLRIVQPVFYQDHYLGAVQFGIDAREILDALKTELGAEAGLVIGNDYFRFISRPLIPAIRHEACAVQASNTEIFEQAGDEICGPADTKQINLKGRYYILKKVLAIRDFKGREICHIVTALDITDMHNAERQAIKWALFIAVTVLLLSFIVLNLSFENLLQNIVTLNERLEAEKEKLQQRVRERTEELALKATEYEMVAHAVHNSIDAFVFTGLEGMIIHSNNACCKLFGYEQSEFIGQFIDILLADEAKDSATIIIEQTKKLGRWTGNITCCKKDGTTITCLLSTSVIHDFEGKPVGMVGIVRDLSDIQQIEKEKETIEAQLRQASKLESIGRLAGGVAHDFNNILNVINGYAELGLLEAEPGHPLHDKLMGILKAGRRASELTQQLLAFSRKQVIKQEAVDFNSLLRDVEKMLDRILGEHIEIKTKIEPGLLPIFADRSQLEQIVMNLAVNAHDAMPSGGKLTIEASNFNVDEITSHSLYGLPPGKYVKIEVSDTGEGMSDQVKERIFEPFFTTKGQSKGTGLGLATVYGIVKQNNGAIIVYSELGHGTTFKIILPAAENKKANEPQEDEWTEQPEVGSGTILLVEDDPGVRILTNTMLTNIGYRVVEADLPEKAIDMFHDIREEVDLLLTDVIMPGMNGPELAHRLREIRPDLKVLYMSGYTADTIADKGILKEGVNLIHKPFTMKSLSEAVKGALSAQQSE